MASSNIDAMLRRFFWGSDKRQATPTAEQTATAAYSRTSSPVLPSEKKDADIATTSISPTSTLGRALSWQALRYPISDPTARVAWNPRLFQIRPLAGLLALLVTIGCVFASLAILAASDGKPTTAWPIQPTVYLAIVAAIANSALRLARTQAIPISWWYHAYRGGTVQSLERHWLVNDRLVQAVVQSRKHLSLLNLACIASAFMIIDGPLLQRASTVVRGDQPRNVTLQMIMPPELPTGLSGYYWHGSMTQNADIKSLGGDYINDRPMMLNCPECKGTVGLSRKATKAKDSYTDQLSQSRARILGPGVAKTNCSFQTWPITPAMTHNMSAQWGPWHEYDHPDNGASVSYLPMFYTELGVYPQPLGSSEAAYLTTGLVSWVDLRGEFVQTVCLLRPAIVEYEVVLKDNIVTLPRESNTGRVISLANNTVAADFTDMTTRQSATMDAITYFMGLYIQTNASVELIAREAAGGGFYTPNAASMNIEVYRHWNLTGNSCSDLSFHDPIPGIIFDFNQIMFRAGVMAASFPSTSHLMDPGLSLNQTVQATQTLSGDIFRSDLRWYVLTIGVHPC